MTESPWRWHSPVAQLALNDVHGSIDVTQLHVGISNLQVHRRKQLGSILGVAVSQPDDRAEVRGARLREAYVRGNDLVTKYDDSAGQPIRTTVYWRGQTIVGQNVSYPAVSLAVSIETDLLDTYPTIQVTSIVKGSETVVVRDLFGEHPVPNPPDSLIDETGCVTFSDQVLVVYRWVDTNWSYAEMTHPSDFQRLTLFGTGPQQVDQRAEWRLFGQFLEKGVIRRARLQGVWLPKRDDVPQALECYRAFVESKIPLTV